MPCQFLPYHSCRPVVVDYSVLLHPILSHRAYRDRREWKKEEEGKAATMQMPIQKMPYSSPPPLILLVCYVIRPE